MNLPNIISLARLVAAPVTVWLILTGYDTLAFSLFVTAGVSDAIDGLIARHFGRATLLGGYLDPIADKALLVGAYLSLGDRGLVPLWLVILVVSRDILIVGGAILVHTMTRRLRMEPLLVSKANTVAQIVLVAVILAGLGLGLDVARWVDPMIWVVAATTAASGAAYVVTWARRLAAEGEP